ncbi:hypothetical protein [Streptomyces sp. NPDC087300]|uniref:hypothetical protein n=1 Tax=Streptomyces sp. NPDC087300 TaxID=3365780 RepID=UPI0038143938
MNRINVYAYPETEWDEVTLAGWFNKDSATEYEEATTGINGTSVNPVGKFEHQSLYRTAKGRWVLCTWSQYEGVDPRNEFADDATAKDWLIRNEEDAAVAQWFGELEEESGPNLGGRPSVGPKVEVRLDAETLRRIRIEEFAAGRARADALRDLIAARLNALDAA